MDSIYLDSRKKIWVFSSYRWQGNPKALFLYMLANHQGTHDCWWLTDTLSEAETLKSRFKIKNILWSKSDAGKRKLELADVYVVENNREYYPSLLSDKTIVFNTWHGVGIKHIELGLDVNTASDASKKITDSVFRKTVKNHSIYKNNTYLLVTSEMMEKHFLAELPVNSSNIVRGPYPRNVIYQSDYLTYEFNVAVKRTIQSYSQVILFAPTWRIRSEGSLFQQLLPNIPALLGVLESRNALLIIKMHPLFSEDYAYTAAKSLFGNNKNIVFWDDYYDIYEHLGKIDIAIIDYSSIFYDLLASGVKKFIRYIPDHDDYVENSDLIGNYLELTDGVVAKDFQQLQNILGGDVPDVEKYEMLMNRFFAYRDGSVDSMIDLVDKAKVRYDRGRILCSFDLFDTLIRRTTIEPVSIFYAVQKRMRNSDRCFPGYLLENWPDLRIRAERDVRDIKRKTIFERGNDFLEVTFDEIYQRIEDVTGLSRGDIDYLKGLEVDAELNSIEPITEKIEFLFAQKNKGYDVIIISDMYLPIAVVRQMMINADSRLGSIPLFLSSELGVQKSTGQLYKHVFFSARYHYDRWLHFGDNAIADGEAARKYGIEAFVHHKDSLVGIEKVLVEKLKEKFGHEAYQLAGKWHRYRESLRSRESSRHLEVEYYAYAYVGSALVPYVHWCLLDSIERGYETLYFISRDGELLKKIADEIIVLHDLPIKTRYIYGSRAAWRVPSFIDKVDDEMFGPFGNFVGLNSFDDLVRASFLSEKELLDLFPEFVLLRGRTHLRGKTSEHIRSVLGQSVEYKKRLLEIAAERRPLVLDYLRQEIDFNESFAFVEFWGRGYTQDVFHRLLQAAAVGDVDNSFYYVRSYTNGSGRVKRHNFIVSDQNFSYFEPIFASVPYKSVREYFRDESGKVLPVLNSKDDEFFSIFVKGALDFVNDYIPIVCHDESLIRAIAVLSYDYQLTCFSDQFICSVYGDLKYNEASFGDARKVAPELRLDDLKSVHDRASLTLLSNKLEISLSRSSQDVRDFYDKNFQKNNWPKILHKEVAHLYAIKDFSFYLRPASFPYLALAVKDNAVFMDASFSQKTKRKDVIFKKNTIIVVIGLEWLRNGVPRLLTEYGYVTAHRDYVSSFGDNESNAVLDIGPCRLKGYEYDSVLGFKSLSDERSNLTRRKWRKFAKDPHQYFYDAKKPVVRVVRHLFDRGHFAGRFFTAVVRRCFG